MAGGAAATAAGLLSAVAAGLLPASIALSGPAFTVSADGVRLQEVALYPVSARRGTVVAMVREGTMAGLCQSTLVPTPLGDLTVRVTAGEGRPVTAARLVMDAEQLGADAEFTEVELGEFVAGELRMHHFRMSARSISAGSFHLSGMRVSARPGRHECI